MHSKNLLRTSSVCIADTRRVADEMQDTETRKHLFGFNPTQFGPVAKQISLESECKSKGNTLKKDLSVEEERTNYTTVPLLQPRDFVGRSLFSEQEKEDAKNVVGDNGKNCIFPDMDRESASVVRCLPGSTDYRCSAENKAQFLVPSVLKKRSFASYEKLNRDCLGDVEHDDDCAEQFKGWKFDKYLHKLDKCLIGYHDDVKFRYVKIIIGGTGVHFCLRDKGPCSGNATLSNVTVVGIPHTHTIFSNVQVEDAELKIRYSKEVHRILVKKFTNMVLPPFACNKWKCVYNLSRFDRSGSSRQHDEMIPAHLCLDNVGNNSKIFVFPKEEDAVSFDKFLSSEKHSEKVRECYNDQLDFIPNVKCAGTVYSMPLALPIAFFFQDYIDLIL